MTKIDFCDSISVNKSQNRIFADKNPLFHAKFQETMVLPDFNQSQISNFYSTHFNAAATLLAGT